MRMLNGAVTMAIRIVVPGEKIDIDFYNTAINSTFRQI